MVELSVSDLNQILPNMAMETKIISSENELLGSHSDKTVGISYQSEADTFILPDIKSPAFSPEELKIKIEPKEDDEFEIPPTTGLSCDNDLLLTSPKLEQMEFDLLPVTTAQGTVEMVFEDHGTTNPQEDMVFDQSGDKNLIPTDLKSEAFFTKNLYNKTDLEKKHVLLMPNTADNLELIYKCTICGNRFLDQKHFAIHLNLHTQSWKCTQCHRNFFNKYTLKRHMQIHSQEKLHKCRQCDKTFFDKYALIKHVPTHLEEKRYKCSFCDKAYSRKSSLIRHVDIHSQNKHHKCSFCEKVFFERNHLRDHQRTHTVEKKTQVQSM